MVSVIIQQIWLYLVNYFIFQYFLKYLYRLIEWPDRIYEYDINISIRTCLFDLYSSRVPWNSALKKNGSPLGFSHGRSTLTFGKFHVHYMGVSKNSGTPKSSILIGFSIINHPFWSTTILGNTHILTSPVGIEPAKSAIITLKGN